MSFWDAIATLSMHHLAFFTIALLVAFGFEFINGFHDTANAVTTVIYTRTLKPTPAVIDSGTMNFFGVLLGRHHGRVQADCDYGGGKDRQNPPDLCSGSSRGDGRRLHDLSRRLCPHAGEHHAGAFERRGWNDGSERLGSAANHATEDWPILGLYLAGCNSYRCRPLRGRSLYTVGNLLVG